MWLGGTDEEDEEAPEGRGGGGGGGGGGVGGGVGGGGGGGGRSAGQSVPGNSFLAAVRYTASSWQPSVSPCQCL